MKVSKQWLENKIKSLNEWLLMNETTLVLGIRTDPSYSHSFPYGSAVDAK